MDTALAVLIASSVGAAYLVAIAYAIVQIVRTRELSQNEKLVWVVIVVCAPLFGSLVWYVAGPHPFGLRLPREFG